MSQLTEHQTALLERCDHVLRFLAHDPDEAACEKYMQENDIQMSGAKKTARQKLIVYAGLHIRTMLGRYVT